jgi:hypothetical protein
MFYTRLYVILILAVNLVNALPVLETSSLERRVNPPKSDDPKDWPSKSDLRGSLITQPGQAKFWAGHTPDHTGSPVSAQESAEADAAAHGGTTLESALNRGGHTMPGWNPKNKAAKDKWTEASKAFADGASGHVHAHVGTTVREDSVYTNEERPALKKNRKVSSITEHAHGQPGVDPKVVHQRGDKKKCCIL